MSPLRAVPSEILTYEELAERMRVSVKTVERMKADGMPFISWGRRRVVFDPVEAMAWAMERKAA